MTVWLLLLAMLMPVAAEAQLPPTGPGSRPVVVYELVRSVPPVPAIKARSAIVLDLGTGTTLFQLDAHGRHAPASLTKIVTALVALDALRPLWAK
jgi:D-alanyl-D-alanine carboxypeptidase